MASASEDELVAMFYNPRKAIPIHITLEEIVHQQPPNNVTVDNSKLHGLTQGTMIPKESKALGMRFHWLNCQEARGHLHYLWRKNNNNRDDYHTKHIPPRHHRDMHTEYLAHYSVHGRKWHIGLNSIIQLLHYTLR